MASLLLASGHLRPEQLTSLCLYRIVVFASGSSELDQPARAMLDGSEMSRHLLPSSRLVLEAEVKVGADSPNDRRLARRRMDVVRRYLLARGFPASRLGATRPPTSVREIYFPNSVRLIEYGLPSEIPPGSPLC